MMIMKKIFLILLILFYAPFSFGGQALFDKSKDTASDISITDANGYTVATTIEGWLSELAGQAEIPSGVSSEFYKSADTYSVTLAWNQRGNRTLYYEIYRSEGSAAFGETPIHTTDDDVLTWTDTTGSVNTQYRYGVMACWVDDEETVHKSIVSNQIYAYIDSTVAKTDQANTFTEPQILEGGVQIGPTDEDAEIGLPKANQTGEEEGDFKIKRDESGNLIIQAIVSGSWTTIGYDATTKSFKLPQVYTVSGSDSFGLSDATVSTVINEYTVAGTDSFTMADAGSNTLTPATPTYSTDKCTGGTIVASSEVSGQEKEEAFDNDESGLNGWQAATPPEWIRYDFGSGVAHAICRVRVKCGNSFAGFNRAYVIQGSNTASPSTDDSSWTQLATGEFANTYQWNDVDFTNTTEYRHVRIKINTAWNNDYAVIQECEMMVLE